MTFWEMYSRLAGASVAGRTEEEMEKLKKEALDPHQLDCLLNPQEHPVVWNIGGPCACKEGEERCTAACLFGAVSKDEKGNAVIDPNACVGCGACVDACKAQKLVESKDILPCMKVVCEAKAPVYVLVAPAFISQFSSAVTPGKLRSAFKKLGFAGMVEVALFADILTLKEALEFDRTIQTDEDFLLTSCCCPIWIAMIRKVYSQLSSHLPAAVSPMVACGRSIKLLHPDAVTVFVGPCMAKKAEAREPDISDAVDFVLTFQEVADIFAFAGIEPENMEEDMRDHSSRAGRIYARTGGVSEALEATVQQLSPLRPIPVRAQQADGVPACRAMLNDLVAGKSTANFLEGMGCVGGCVGGPRAILDREEGRKHVNEYGDEAPCRTPADNPYVIELLHRLGLDTVESLLEHSDIFTRDFSTPPAAQAGKKA